MQAFPKTEHGRAGGSNQVTPPLYTPTPTCQPLPGSYEKKRMSTRTQTESLALADAIHARAQASFAPSLAAPNAEYAGAGRVTGRRPVPDLAPALASSGYESFDPSPALAGGSPAKSRRRAVQLRRDRAARSEARREAALGSNGKTASAALPGPSVLSDWAASVQRRYSLQTGAKHLLGTNKRLCGCHAWLAREDQGGVKMIAYPTLGRARFGNLQTCASVWMCPVCSAKICERRREWEVAPALKRAKQLGWFVLMVTFTVRHDCHDQLSALMEGLKAARKASRSGRRAANLARKYGIEGSIRVLEITHGANGWHPHIHELLFLSAPYYRQDLLSDLAYQWKTGVALAGLKGVNHHGVKVSDAHAKIEDYVTKIGRDPAWGLAEELTKQPVKSGRMNPETGEKGRSAFQLLASYTYDGDIHAGGLFVEYTNVLHGERQLYWSPGLKAKLGVAEMTDAQIEQMEEQEKLAVDMGELHPAEFKLLLTDDLRAECLDVMKAADAVALEDFLAPYRSTCENGRVTTKHLPKLVDPWADDRDALLPESDPFASDPLVKKIAALTPDLTPGETAAMAIRFYMRQANGDDLPICRRERRSARRWVLEGPSQAASAAGPVGPGSALALPL